MALHGLDLLNYQTICNSCSTIYQGSPANKDTYNEQCVKCTKEYTVPSLQTTHNNMELFVKDNIRKIVLDEATYLSILNENNRLTNELKIQVHKSNVKQTDLERKIEQLEKLNLDNSLQDIPKVIDHIKKVVSDEKGAGLGDYNINRILKTSVTSLKEIVSNLNELKDVSDKRIAETSWIQSSINAVMHSVTTYKKGKRCSVGKFAIAFCKALETFKATKNYKELGTRSFGNYERVFERHCIQEITKLANNKDCVDIVSKNHTDLKREFSLLLSQWKTIDIPAKDEKGKGGSGLSILDRQMRAEPLSEDILTEVLLGQEMLRDRSRARH
jgi:hypothetical protein